MLVGTDNFESRLFDVSRILPGVCPDHSISPTSSTNEMIYQFDSFVVSVSPNRISVEQIENQILTEGLETIVGNVVEILDASQNHNVTAMGFNLNTLIMQNSNHMTGTQFCASMMDLHELGSFVDGSVQFGCLKSVFFRDGLNCTLQLEPEFRSHGANLVMAINIHKDIGSLDSLIEKIQHSMGQIRPFLSDLCVRIQDTFRGNANE